MSSKFTTPLILSSALALSAFSFIACSEDSNPGIPSQVGNSSSSYVPPDIPQQTATTAIVFSGLGADQTMATQVFFTGSIKLDFSDTNITPENSTIRFTDLKLFVESASKTSSGSIKTNLSADGSIPADYFATQQPTTISFDKIGLYADLADGYTECGNFNLIIAATAMDPANEATKSVSIDTIPFIRGEQNCKIPESSSSSIAVPGAPLVAGTATISTKDNKCFTFATGTATTDATIGDICITRYTKDSFTLSSGTGLKFAFYDNPKDADRKNDWTSERLPEAPTTDNFTYKEANLKETISNIQNEIENFVVCIAPTYVPNSGSATGFYTFTISDVSVPDGNGDVVFSITYLKAAQ
jgi:hypothetical protein